MNLKGKVALITGGGTGIGAAVAKRFVADGARICITGRREGCLDEVIASLPTGAATKCPGDVTKPEDTERMVKTVLSFGEKIDVLVNCAGLGGMGSITDIDPVDWRKTFEVNLNGPFLLMRAVIPHMIKAGGGSIINISSLAGLRCQPKATAYSASKAALNMLTRQVAFDYRRYNIAAMPSVRGLSTRIWLKRAAWANLRKGLVLICSASTTYLKIYLSSRSTQQIAEYAVLAGDDSLYMTGAVIGGRRDSYSGCISDRR